MKKVKIENKTKHYKIRIREKANGYSARITLKLGGGINPRWERCAKERDVSVIKLLIHIQEVLSQNMKKGFYNASYITFDAYNTMAQSVKEENVATAGVIRELNKISTLYVKADDENNTTSNNCLQTTKTTADLFVEPTDNSNNTLSNSTANNISFLADYSQNINTQQQQLYDVDKLMKTTLATLSDKWFKYKLNLCKETKTNPKPLSQKTVDGYHRNLHNVVLKYFEENEITLVSQITEGILKELILSQNRILQSRYYICYFKDVI